MEIILVQKKLRTIHALEAQMYLAKQMFHFI